MSNETPEHRGIQPLPVYEGPTETYAIDPAQQRPPNRGLTYKQPDAQTAASPLFRRRGAAVSWGKPTPCGSHASPDGVTRT